MLVIIRVVNSLHECLTVANLVIRFLLALAVNGVVTVREPVQKGVRPVVGIMFGECLHTIGTSIWSVWPSR